MFPSMDFAVIFRYRNAIALPGLFRASLFGLVGLACAVAVSPAARAGAGVFGSTETVSTDLKPFPRWTETLERYFAERGTVDGPCQSKEFNRCHYDKWMGFLDSVRNLPPEQQMTHVNGFLNKSRYIVDPINWGMKDYWATPGQFLARFGDCEDYAIAKYLSLRELGWDTETMRIVVLQDLNLRVPHAILVVRQGGKNFVLDNQISIVVEDKRIKHYRPIYSVNETRWWRHRAG